MNNSNTIPKLTTANWDETTKTHFHLKFLNDRNAIRAVLYDLVQIDNEINCTNLEIQTLKTNFDTQLNSLEAEGNRIQQDDSLELDMKNKLNTQIVRQIEETNQEFSDKIEKYQLSKETNCKAVNQNVEKLFQLKSQFVMTHKVQVESLKRFRAVCERSLRPLVEVRLKSVDRKFCDELFYICSCEKDLKHIFSLIEDDSSCSEVGSTSSSTTLHSKEYLEFLSDFAWMRNGKDFFHIIFTLTEFVYSKFATALIYIAEQITKRSELFEFFKKHLAKDLVGALAVMYIRQPEQPIRFLATYLKHLKNNEFRMKTQEMIFAAAKNGESLFPESTNN